ncbi:MAG: hypothetical protein M8467_08510 [Anaerolineae bacterium]|nr:hypothetical protein [Anaerolineae bacterium]
MTFAGSSNPVIEAVTALLERRGYRVTRSFDLQSARNHHVEHCPCPHHGTEECTCQYVVLLAYPPVAAGVATGPRVFTVHTYGQMTQVALQHDETLDEDERFALVSVLIKAAMLLAPDQPVIENQAGIPIAMAR